MSKLNKPSLQRWLSYSNLSLKNSFKHLNIALLACIPTFTSLAEDILPTTQSKDMVITATRSERDILDIPFLTNTITSEKQLERAYPTVPQMLNDVPGVLVQETSTGQGSPYIRGFTGYHTLMLIDGIRLNNSVFRSGPNQYFNTIDPFSIEKLEVVKGPSSVLYGSDAIGGTINAITKSPYAWGQEDNFAGQALYQISSGRNSHIAHGEITFNLQENTGMLIGGTGKQFGNIEGGAEIGTLPDTAYGEYDVDFKLEHFINDDTRLVIAHQRVSVNNAPRTHRTRNAVPFYGSTIGSDLRRDFDQDRELTYLQLHAENIQDAPFDTMRLSVSHQRQSELRHRIRSSGATEFQGFDVDTLGIWSQFESDSPIGRLTYGFEFYHDNVNSFSSTNAVQGPVADDATYDLLGIFIQDDIEVSDRVNVILGGRYTYARANAQSVLDPVTSTAFSTDEDWEAFVGTAKVIYKIDPDHTNLFGGVAQGFRTPNLSDTTRFDSARTNEFEIPSPGLDPEFYTNYEVGVKTRNEDHTTQVAYFYTDIQDQILRFPTGNVNGMGDFEVTKDNVGDGYVNGVELSSTVNVAPHWQLFGSIAWQEGVVTNSSSAGAPLEDSYITRMMPLTSQIGLRWDAPNFDCYFENVVTFASTQDKLSFSDMSDTSRIPPGGTPGYTIWSMRVGGELADNLNYHVTLDNITDEDYRIHGSGQNRPGRNLIFTINLLF